MGPVFQVQNAATTIGMTLGFLSLSSLVREPARQQYMAIILGVAGGTYLDGGLGAWEFPATVAVGWCAARGLAVGQQGYNYIAAGWILHAALDIVHHVRGLPMVRWIPTSSAGCAVTDSILAGWMLLGAPGVFG